MDEYIDPVIVKKRIDKQLFNFPVDIKKEADKDLVLEQYKLLVDAAQRLTERSKDSNSLFITLNSLFLTALTQITPSDVRSEKSLLIMFLLPIGIILAGSWLRIIRSYERLNYVNQVMIEAIEKKFPLSIFSLRSEIVEQQVEPGNKANVILKKEIIIPTIFLFIYAGYSLFICYLMIK